MLKDPHSLFTVVIALGTYVELIVYLPTLNNMVKYALNIIMLYSAACLKYQKWKQNMQAFVVDIMWKNVAVIIWSC